MDVNKDALVKLLVTPAEKAAWQAAADASGIKLSEWIRRRCNGTTTTTIEAPPPNLATTAPAPKKRSSKRKA